MVNRVSNDQLDELLEFLAEHPAIARGVCPGSRSKETVERQWNDLARKLNSFGSGSSKSGERWKKYWADIKHKSKTRLAKRRVDARNNGGGPSNQEDLADIDKKILAIIGKKAVDGHSKQELPVFYIQPEVQDTATVQPNYIVVAEEVVGSDTSDIPEPVASSVEIQTQQVPEPHQTRLESPVSQPQPARSRRRLRQNRPCLNSNSTSILSKRIDREWLKESERNRVRAENKMADAALMIAEAANKIADSSLIIAETSRMNAETNRMNAETNRKQLEVMKAIMDVVHQRATGVSETALLHILKEEAGRNAGKPQEPPEKRHRARRRSRQSRSSSEADSSDDNDGDNEQSSNYHGEEPEIEVAPTTAKVASDTEVNKVQAQTDPISLEVKTEPRGDEMDNTNETLSLNEPAGTKSKGRKIPRRSDATSTRSGLFGETQMKAGEIENYEEGFS